MLLLALSTSHKVGLGLAVAGFAGFALIVSMLVPRWSPQFPGRGLKVFLVVVVLIFLAMLAAVEFLGKESGEAKAEGAETTASTQATTTSQSTTTSQTTTSGGGGTVQVSEVEYKIHLAKSSLAAGSYTFDVHNDGKFPHDLVVKGPGESAKTPLLDAGQSKTLRVDLKPGTYDLYCSVPGHKQLGMDLKLTVS